MNYIENRPWGEFEILYESEVIKVKRILVYPKKRLSLQSHEFRSETWTVSKGELGVVCGETKDSLIDFRANIGEHITIEQGAIHRAYNDSEEIAEFVEVQVGTYLEEDDIIRYEDDFGRK